MKRTYFIVAFIAVVVGMGLAIYGVSLVNLEVTFISGILIGAGLEYLWQASP